MSRRARIDLGVGGRYLGIVLLATVALSASSAFSVSPRFRPDLLSPIIVFLALELELIPGLLVASGIGYLAGVFSGEPRGLYWSAAVIVFLLLRLFVFRVVGSRLSTVVVVVLVSTVLNLLVRTTIELVFGAHRSPLSSMMPALGSLLLGAVLLGYPLYWLFCRLDLRLKPKGDQFFEGR